MDANQVQSFEKLLAEQNKQFADAEVFSSWMPPDGEYIVQVISTGNGVTTDKETSVNHPWWKITGKILVEASNPKLVGATFTVGYYSDKAYGLMKGAACVIAGQQVINGLKEASEVILASKGKVLKVKVETRTTKRGSFTGCSILEVLPGVVQETPSQPTT